MEQEPLPESELRDFLSDIEDMKEIEIPDSYVVKAGDELLPLCAMCKKSKLTCENHYIREDLVPLEPGDDPKDEVIMYQRKKGKSPLQIKTGMKYIDIVKAGLITSEDDIPDPFICEWFDPKNPG